MPQKEIDNKNAKFWDELCGTSLARSIGITEITPETLKKFDQVYMGFYPYLAEYVTRENLKKKKVLEIGLGFGTLGQFLSSQGCDYYGLDIAEGPVAMMMDRLQFLGKQANDHIRVGSALEIPYDNESFDYVYSIGCLHHTGDLPKSINEVYRVLGAGGKAIVMLYNRNSFRQLVQIPYRRFRDWVSRSRKRNFAEWQRSLYDTNSSGDAAPYTEYVSRGEVRRLFAKFSELRIDSQNFDSYVLFKRFLIPREKLLSNLGRVLGLDLYIVARK